tara:strand:- start:44 stop:841 length:798 start_codon:yes stop_codon:yes gene_type:complete
MNRRKQPADNRNVFLLRAYFLNKVNDLSFDLKMVIIWSCAAVAAVVFIFMFFFMFSHRRSKGGESAHFHDHLGVETVWTLLPVFILIGMTLPAVTDLIESRDAQNHKSMFRNPSVDGVRGSILTLDDQMIGFLSEIDGIRTDQWILFIFGEGACGLGCEKFFAELRIFIGKSQEARGKINIYYLLNEQTANHDRSDSLKRLLPSMNAVPISLSALRSLLPDGPNFRASGHLGGILVSPDKLTVLFYNFQAGEKNLLEDLTHLLRD